MKERWKWLLPAMLLLCLLPSVVSVASSAEQAPNFTLKDLQGRNFTLSEQKGKFVLLIFGATWCPSCREEIPRFKQMYAKYTSKGVVIVNIDVDEPPAHVARFAAKYKLPYRVLVDERAQVARNYHVRGVPNMVLLDKEGRFVCRECLDVESVLDKLLTK